MIFYDYYVMVGRQWSPPVGVPHSTVLWLVLDLDLATLIVLYGHDSANRWTDKLPLWHGLSPSSGIELDASILPHFSHLEIRGVDLAWKYSKLRHGPHVLCMIRMKSRGFLFEACLFLYWMYKIFQEKVWIWCLVQHFSVVKTKSQINPSLSLFLLCNPRNP